MNPAEDLLDAAVDRARATVTEKAHDLDAEELNRIAEQAGIGAVKYADLSTSRTKDEACPVLSATEPVRANRVALCQLAARTLRQGLNLLGIAAPERM